MKYIVATVSADPVVMVRKHIGDHEVYQVYATTPTYEQAAYIAASLNAAERGSEPG